MSNVAKVAGQAANTLVKPLEVEDVFSTYLYTGTGSSQTITNGIDLSGEGGLVWGKTRNRSSGDFYSRHFLYDTERGTGTDAYLHSDQTDAQGATGALSPGIAFNTNGFTTPGPFNNNNEAGVSWTFRKAPKFFDVVTYTGSDSTQTINHSLASEVGFMVVKRVSSGAGQWYAHHRSLTSGHIIKLNSTDASTSNASSLLYNVTSTSFTVDAGAYHTNAAGETYVAYLWAHNDGDGEFGPDGNADIIKCGSVSYPASGDVEVNLGFEPQWVLYKDVTHSGNNWWILDTMRGWNAQETGGTFSSTTGGKAEALFSDTSGAEVEYDYGALTSTGFKLPSNFNYGDNNTDFIYIAIRRPTAVPTSATEVFAMDTFGGTSPTPPSYVSGFPVDMVIQRHDKNSTSDPRVNSRLTGINFVFTSQSSSETYDSGYTFDYMNGFRRDTGTDANDFTWMWKRAPNYMDVVAYQGTGVAGFTFNHNLGVKPEMIWVKNRGAHEYWAVYHKDLNGGTNPSHYFLKLNDTNAETDYNEIWNDTEPTDTQVTVGQQGVVNSGSFSHIAYLFATLAGISKVGSFSHTNGTNSVVDCGFTSGARFVLLKRTDSPDNWDLWDSTRGINTGTEPKLVLNSNSNESVTDEIDPDGSGFIYSSGGNTGDYIFYAIA